MLNRQTLERDFFRRLNSVVEPAVMRGIGSPSFTPAALIVLESTGFKSGAIRRTPLLSLRLGPYTLISTARGDRSFWVKNLRKQPDVVFYLGGKARPARAFVLSAGKRYRRPKSFPDWLGALCDVLHHYTQRGWCFAILSPRETG